MNEIMNVNENGRLLLDVLETFIFFWKIFSKGDFIKKEGFKKSS